MSLISSVLEMCLQTHFTTILLVILFGIKLYTQKKSRDAELHYFWTPVVCCFLLVLEDVAENITALDPDLYYLRILFSVIGYALRPVAVVGLLLVICPPEKRSWKLWIPCILNTVIFCTAFFSPITFSYDQDYHFIRGPLGYVVFVTAFLYMIQFFVLTWRRFYEVKNTERWILIICAAYCILASMIDMIYGGCRLNEAIMISSIFFFVFLHSHDNRTDPLTALGNRFAFYDDIESRNKSITAVASLDMNGLKRINDTQGHAAGDKALQEIGSCLGRYLTRDTIPYRIGGDEFVMLFLHQDIHAVQKTVEQAKEDVSQAGYSISVGYAMKSRLERIEDALARSDQSMYQDKASYYQRSGIDRRRK